MGHGDGHLRPAFPPPFPVGAEKAAPESRRHELTYRGPSARLRQAVLSLQANVSILSAAQHGSEAERSAVVASSGPICAMCGRPRDPRKREACSDKCRTELQPPASEGRSSKAGRRDPGALGNRPEEVGRGCAMNRRAFLTAFAGSLLAAPRDPVAAQQPKRPWRIGIFNAGVPHPEVVKAQEQLRQGLNKLGDV